MIKFIPGVHPSYKEQFDKLTRAYINDEVEPYISCSCFVGNLLNNKSVWDFGRRVIGNIETDASCLRVAQNCIDRESSGLYSVKEIVDLEARFMLCVDNHNEEGLFNAFSKTLDLLKQIHLSKGEIIDEVPEFKRRVMV
jgi:hypothetical protein